MYGGATPQQLFSFKDVGKAFKKAGGEMKKGLKKAAPIAKKVLHSAASAATVAAPIATAIAPEFSPMIIGGAAALKGADALAQKFQLVVLNGVVYKVPLNDFRTVY